MKVNEHFTTKIHTTPKKRTKFIFHQLGECIHDSVCGAEIILTSIQKIK